MIALSSVWNLKTITNLDMKRAQNTEFIQVSTYSFISSKCCSRRFTVWYQNLRDRLSKANEVLTKFPVLVRGWANIQFVAIAQPFAEASEGKRLCWKICLLNTGVWIFWKINRLRPFMTRSFMHHPLSGLSYTLLTNVFRYLFSLTGLVIYVPLITCVFDYSHRSFMHLFFNCFALESFGNYISGYS
jgi:rhomboid-like protein